jgi:hypothetical protein
MADLPHEILAFYPPDRAREYAPRQLALYGHWRHSPGMSDKIEWF